MSPARPAWSRSPSSRVRRVRAGAGPYRGERGLNPLRALSLWRGAGVSVGAATESVQQARARANADCRSAAALHTITFVIVERFLPASPGGLQQGVRPSMHLSAKQLDRAWRPLPLLLPGFMLALSAAANAQGRAAAATEERPLLQQWPPFSRLSCCFCCGACARRFAVARRRRSAEAARCATATPACAPLSSMQRIQSSSATASSSASMRAVARASCSATSRRHCSR